MNIVDIIILVIIAVNVLLGLYRGFISGVLSVAALIGSAIPGASVYMAKPIWIMQILWMLVNLVLIGGCFMMIVTDEMLENEDKKFAEFIEKNPKLASKKEKQQLEKQAKAKKKSEKKAKKASQRYKATQSK